MQITVFSIVLLIYSSYHTLPKLLEEYEEAADDKLFVSVLVSSLLMASAMIQLGWCGYLAIAIGPRMNFSTMEFVIPESELLEEEASLVKCD